MRNVEGPCDHHHVAVGVGLNLFGSLEAGHQKQACVWLSLSHRAIRDAERRPAIAGTQLIYDGVSASLRAP